MASIVKRGSTEGMTNGGTGGAEATEGEVRAAQVEEAKANTRAADETAKTQRSQRRAGWVKMGAIGTVILGVGGSIGIPLLEKATDIILNKAGVLDTTIDAEDDFLADDYGKAAGLSKSQLSVANGAATLADKESARLGINGRDAACAHKAFYDAAGAAVQLHDVTQDRGKLSAFQTTFGKAIKVKLKSHRCNLSGLFDDKEEELIQRMTDPNASGGFMQKLVNQM